MPNSKDSMEMELLEDVVSELGPSSGGIQRKMGSYLSKRKTDLDHCFWSKKRLISMNGLK